MNKSIKALLFTSLAHFVNDGNFLLFSLMIIYFSELPNISIVLLGVMAILYNVVYGIISPFVGKLADKINKDAFLLFLGISLEGLAAFLFGLVFIFNFLAVLLIILGAIALGAGQSFYHPIGASILSFSYKSKDLGTMLGINGAAGSVGREVVPSFLTFLILVFGRSIGTEILAIYIWLLAIVILFGLRSFKRDIKIKEEKDKKSKMPKKVSHNVKMVIINLFFKGAFMAGTITFISKYIFDITKSAYLTGIILTISLIPAVLGQPVFGYLTTKRGGKFTVGITSVFTFIFFVIFLSTKNVLLLTISYAFIAFFMLTGFSITLDYAYQLVPRRYYSSAYSLVWGIGNILGGASGIALMSLFLTFTSLYNAMWYITATIVISIALIPILLRRGSRT